VAALALVTITWGAAAAARLLITGSELPRDMRRPKPKSSPRTVEMQASELHSGSEP
jgi:hypothetical protein